MKRRIFTWLTAMSVAVVTHGQVKLGDNPTVIDPNALLELENTGKGFLLPRMTAVQRDAIVSPANAMLIFNSTENCINIYNDAESKWKSICGQEAGGSSVFTPDCGSLLVTGTYSTGVELNGDDNFITINVNVTEAGSYNILASSGGMYFADAGVFTTTGTQEIILKGQGYPLVSGVNFLAIPINGELCTTVINVTNGIANITGCGTLGSLTGTLTANQSIDEGTVFQAYTAGPSYTGGAVFGITSSVSNGIRISSPVNGTFTGSGDPIDYYLTGTPVQPGNTDINYSVNGTACSFTVPVQSGTGRASALTCSGTLSGTYVVGTAMTAGNTKVINLTVLTAGTFYVRTNTVNGIYFQGSATLAAGAQNMTLTAVGNPAEAITSSYTVTVSQTGTAFLTCSFNVTATLPPSVPNFASLSCSSLGMGVNGGVNYVKANNTGANDGFGGFGGATDNYTNRGVALSGDGLTMAVGASYEDGDLTGGAINSSSNNNWTNAGAVYIYVRTNKQSNWTFQAKVKPTQLGAGDLFGSTLGLSDNGSTLVVGSPLEDGSGTGINPAHNNSAADAGAAYVFTRSGTTWAQQAYIKADNTGTGDWFGVSVSVSGDGNTVAVGAYQEDGNGTGINPPGNEGATDAGAVYVYSRNVTVWSQQAYIKASNTGTGDLFGRSVSLSTDGNTLAVGASGEDGSNAGINPVQNNSASNAGAAYVFTRSGTAWSQEAYIKSVNIPRAGNGFGSTVALSGDGNTLAVAAIGESGSGKGVNPGANTSAKDAGAAFTYTRSGSTWSNGAYLKASNTGAGDKFGWTLSLSKNGNVVAVGATHEDCNIPCINGTDNNNRTSVGAVYLYHLAGSNWVSSFKLSRITNMGNAVYLYVGRGGLALDATGNTVGIGVAGEDGSATGINGTPNQNATNAGAVITYTRN